MRTLGSFRSVMVIILFCGTTSGCEFSVSGNSSKGDNDYFAEPLSDIVNKYGPALDSSNTFITRFDDNKIDLIYGGFTDSLREGMTVDELRSFREQVIESAGEVSEFLPGQWAFKTGSEDGRDVLYSTKIVIHENIAAYYILVFFDDGVYDKIHGFRVQRRTSDSERVMEVVNSVLAGKT